MGSHPTCKSTPVKLNILKDIKIMAYEECELKPCRRTIPISSVVSIFRSSLVTQSTDCSTNMIYLVDDAGTLGTDSEEPLLTTDNRTYTVSNIQQVSTFYDNCSRVNFELKRLFSIPYKELVRPKTVTLLYFDSDSEEMIDVLEEYYRCNNCFYSVSHIAYDKNGDSLFDEPDKQLPLGQFGKETLTTITLPTADNDNYIKAVETESLAYQAKMLEYETTFLVLLNDECPYVLDDDCNATEEIETVKGMQHLLFAGLAVSRSIEADDASVNYKFKPIEGVKFSGISPADLDPDNLNLIIGTDPTSNGTLAESPHHVNVYYNLGGQYLIFGDAISATGVTLDKILHRRYIQNTLAEAIVELMVTTNAVSITNLSSLRTIFTTQMLVFTENGMIDNNTGALDKSEFDEDSIYL